MPDPLPPSPTIAQRMQEAAVAMREFDRQIRLAAASVARMLEPFGARLRALAREVERAERRRDLAAKRKRKRRHQRTGRGYR